MIASSVSPQARINPISRLARGSVTSRPMSSAPHHRNERAGTSKEAPARRVSLLLMPATRRPRRQPSSTAPVYGAMVRVLTWAPVGVVMVAPRFTVTVAEEGFTSTRPLVNERWYTPPKRY